MDCKIHCTVLLCLSSIRALSLLSVQDNMWRIKHMFDWIHSLSTREWNCYIKKGFNIQLLNYCVQINVASSFLGVAFSKWERSQAAVFALILARKASGVHISYQKKPLILKYMVVFFNPVSNGTNLKSLMLDIPSFSHFLEMSQTL